MKQPLGTLTKSYLNLGWVLGVLALSCLFFRPYSGVQAQNCSGGNAGGFGCSNVNLLSNMNLSALGAGAGQEGSDIWGWTDPMTGNEYALMCLTDGMAFVDITNPSSPVRLGNLPTQTGTSFWRDVKVYNNYAFIVSDSNGSHGMQVFDLTRLRSVASPPTTFTNDAWYSGVTSAHNIAINEATGYAYIVGSNRYSGGLHFVDLSNPLNPVDAGGFNGDGYTHDVQCVIYHGPDCDYQGMEICFASNEDTHTLVNVTNKSNPVQISRVGYAGSSYTHQGWLTDDHTYVLMNDETDEYNGHGTRTYIWDMTDLDNPVMIGFYEAPFGAIDHNLYIVGDLAYEANYRSGLRILNINNIASASLTEVAYFDTYPGSNSTQFNGAWSCYPFFDSGVVIVSDIDRGLFILEPTIAPSTWPAAPSCNGCIADAGDLSAPANTTTLAVCEGNDLFQNNGTSQAIFGVSYAASNETNPGTGYDYAYILTQNDATTYTIISSNTSGDFDFSTLTAGTYQVWGISYATSNPTNNVLTYLNGAGNIQQIKTDITGGLCANLTDDPGNAGGALAVMVQASPVITPPSTNPQACPNANITINISVTGSPTSYAWSAPSGGGSFANAGIQNPTYTAPSTAGSYALTVTATDALGCSDTEVVTVDVGTCCPTTVGNFNNSESFCASAGAVTPNVASNTAITNSLDVPPPDAIISWSPNPSTPISFDTNQSLCAPQTFTYTLTIQCANDPTVNLSGGTHTVTIYPEPQAPSITRNDNACNYTVTPTCSGDGLSSTSFSQSPGTSAGTMSITVTSTISGTTCSTQSFNVAYSACPSLSCPGSTIPNIPVTACDGDSPALPNANVQATISDPDGTQLGGISWFEDVNLTIPYSGSVNHNSGNLCNTDVQTLYAGIQCDSDLDGTANGGYILVGLSGITIYPEPQMPTIVQNNSTCSYIVNPSCSNDGLSETTFNLAPGTASGTRSITVTSNISGTICTPQNFNVPYIACSGVRVEMRVLLEGPHTFAGMMATDLQNGINVLPTQQPYNQAPWNYGGMESVVNKAAIPANTVDWVLIELRDGSNFNTMIAQATGFLLNNGNVVDVTGAAGLPFPVSAGNYYVVVRHRSHLDVISSMAISLPNTGSRLDFTDPNNVMNGLNQLTFLSGTSGLYGLHAGDVNGNGLITVGDYNEYILSLNGPLTDQYKEGDCDMDGNLTVNDFNTYRPNASIIGLQTIRY